LGPITCVYLVSKREITALRYRVLCLHCSQLLPIVVFIQHLAYLLCVTEPFNVNSFVISCLHSFLVADTAQFTRAERYALCAQKMGKGTVPLYTTMHVLT
jgi:hypothetical protein